MAGKKLSKTELVEAVASQSGLEKKQVNAVLDALSNVVYQELKREGINPFTKEKTMFKAKPERKVIKARPVKALKDAV